MKKSFCLTACTAAATLALTASCATAAVTAFRVNGELITKDEQEQVISQYTARGQARTPQLEQRVRLSLTANALLMQEAKKLKIAEKPAVKQQLEASRENILKNATLSAFLEKNPVTLSDVRKVYDLEKERWGDKEVTISLIIVKDEAAAKDVIVKLRGGDDFAKLSQEVSIANPQVKQAGGTVQWVSPNFLEPAVAKALTDLKKGGLTRKPVETPQGWYVVRLEDERAAQRYSSFEAVGPQLERDLLNHRAQTYVDGLVKSAKIVDVADKKPVKK